MTVKHMFADSPVGTPTVLTFEQYVTAGRDERLRASWRDYFVRNLPATQTAQAGQGGINLDIPVKIQSKAFQKIFGSGTLGLNVTGNISIKAALRRENRSEVRTVLNRGANTNFQMEQTQRFSVTGKIGDKVTVNVDQDSERAFDFENNVRIAYQGYEDEIIQKIEAGNISLSLPGTRYVTFSGKNSGLFGLKSELVLGNMNITAIASQEKGESQKISLSGGASEGAKRIRDYQYLRNTYFFLDFGYREDYRNFFNDGNHFASPRPIVDIEVFKAAAGYEEQFPDESVGAWATLNALPSDTTAVQPGFADFGHFIRLEKDEYHVENSMGFIRLNNQISPDEILAVTYTFDNGGNTVTVGDTVNNTVIFKLIKPKNPRPTDATWDLEWKHVYSLGARQIEQEGFDVKIFFEPPSGVPDEVDTSGRKWLQVFGLDTRDQDGNANSPDGLIDLGGTLVDLFNGELHFPDLQPFDPVGFKINSQDVPIELPVDKRTSAIYDTTVQSVISAQSKFFIEVKTQNRSSDFNLGFNI
ncbi:hypothetical protein MJD09_08655, partial [bacterium]|nr:hypothetical protein [bacterium]